MAESLNLTIERNATFVQTWTYVDMDAYKAALADGMTPAEAEVEAAIDLTGYSARMVGLPSYDALIDDAMFDIDDSAGGTGDVSGIAIDEALGKVTAVISKADTAAIIGDKGVFDIKITSPADVDTRLGEGSFVVTPGATP